MGKLAGLGGEKVTIIRTGTRFNPDPEAYSPIPFRENVDSPNYEESWSDSLIMYHNPNALHPVDPNDFPDISHMFSCDENGCEGYYQPYDVLDSVSLVMSVENPISKS